MSTNIYVTKDDYEASKNFLIQFLRDSGYEGSLEDGTALHDVVIKAFALFYSLYRRQTEKVKAYLSVNNAIEMRDVLGDEFDEVVDSILTNWFVQRKEGTKASGYVRLWFTRPLPFINFYKGNLLGVINSQRFAVFEDKVFVEDDFSSVANGVNNITEYYIDIQVESEQNTDYTPGAGVLVSAYVNSLYFLRAETRATFNSGSLKESSMDFINRTSKVITTREMITDRAIYTVLMDKIAGIYDVYTAGYGKPEQMRDVVDFEGVSVHVGNKCDIYVAGQVTTTTGKLVVDSEGNINLKNLGAYAHVCGIKSTSIVQDNNRSLTNYQLASVDEVTFGSLGSEIILSLPGAFSGDDIEVEYYTVPTVLECKNLLFNEDNRVVCYDPLVKSKFLLKLFFNIKITIKAGTEPSKVIAEIKDAVIDFIDLTNKYKEVYRESELIRFLHTMVPSVYAYEVPIVTTYKTIDPKTSTEVTGAVSDYVVIDDLPISSKQFTKDTVMFFTDLEAITVTVEKVI